MRVFYQRAHKPLFEPKLKCAQELFSGWTKTNISPNFFEEIYDFYSLNPKIRRRIIIEFFPKKLFA